MTGQSSDLHFLLERRNRFEGSQQIHSNHGNCQIIQNEWDICFSWQHQDH